jgi:nicotinate-nucleotide adenylyltransferase
MRWGLLGGTFDPIHFGHLRGAEEMLGIFNLNRIIFVP